MTSKEQYCYYHYLNNQLLKNQDDLRKGERTRQKLLLATTRLLDEVGYHGLTTANICKAAELSSATFYLYFKNRKEIVLALLSGFSQYLYDQLKLANQENKANDRIKSVNRAWVHTTSKNSGLLRCLYQMTDEDSEFDDLVNSLNHNWYLSVAKSLNKNNDTSNPEHLITAYAMGNMTDELTRNLFTRNNPYLNEAFQQLGWEEEQLADFITNIWKKAGVAYTPTP